MDRFVHCRRSLLCDGSVAREHVLYGEANVIYSDEKLEWRERILYGLMGLSQRVATFWAGIVITLLMLVIAILAVMVVLR